MMSAPATPENPTRRRRWLVTLPLIGFMAIAGLFLVRLYGGDPAKIPSALIGRPAPQAATCTRPDLMRTKERSIIVTTG